MAARKETTQQASDGEPLRPANPLETQALAAFEEPASRLKRLDALAIGALDGGVAARLAARGGASAALIDEDPDRLQRARSASAGLKIGFHKASLADLRQRADPGSFDVALSHLALARVESLPDAFGALFPLLRTDCLLAFTLPNPYLAKRPPEDDPLAERRAADGIAGWLAGPVFYRPLGVVTEALRDAGFLLSGVRDFPGEPGRPETACLLFECGKEKW